MAEVCDTGGRPEKSPGATPTGDPPDRGRIPGGTNPRVVCRDVLELEVSLGLIERVLDGTFAPDQVDYDEWVHTRELRLWKQQEERSNPIPQKQAVSGEQAPSDKKRDMDVADYPIELRRLKRRKDYNPGPIVGVLPREIDELFWWDSSPATLVCYPTTPEDVAHNVVVLGLFVAAEDATSGDWWRDDESREQLDGLVLQIRRCRREFRDRVVAVIRGWAATGIPEEHTRSEKPQWDAQERELSFRERPLKTYDGHSARNQVLVLEEFEKLDWPQSIRLPSSLRPDQRHDTIRGLNNSLGDGSPIRFRGAGDGDRIRWDVIVENPSPTSS